MEFIIYVLFYGMKISEKVLCASNRDLNSQLIKILMFIFPPCKMKSGCLRSGVVQGFYNVKSVPASFFLFSFPAIARVYFCTVSSYLL